MTISDEEQIPPVNSNHAADEAVPSQPVRQYRRRIFIGIGLTLAGYAIFLLGARPSVYGLDRSPVIGFVQIAVFIVGIGIISYGAHVTIQALWQGKATSIASQIGMRMIQTGFVIALFTGMADVFGLGSHRLPRPFFGPLQATGVQIGELVIGLGIFLMFPFHRFFPMKKKRPINPEANKVDSEYQ